MRNLFIVCLLLAAITASGTFGNFPLTNGAFIAVSDWQCLYSGIVERCYVADVAPAALALPVNVYTGMYVSSVTTGEHPVTITTNVPPTTNHTYYYTTNWLFGDVSRTLTNWSGTVSWAGPMSAATLAAWDAKLIDVISSYCDPFTNQELYLQTALSVTTDGWTGVVSTNYPSTPMMLTQSNLWKRFGIGAHFHYSYIPWGLTNLYPVDNYKFTIQPTSTVEVVLASFCVKVTNTFYTTNVTSGLTNVVRNVNLGLVLFAGSIVPTSLMKYPDWTNTRPFFRMLPANTNADMVAGLADAIFYIKGSESKVYTNAAPSSAVYTNDIFTGISQSQRLVRCYNLIGTDPYYTPFLTPGSSSIWSRVETNGQWDTMQGTIIEIVWSNRIAFYGTPQGAISATALNERFTVLTSLIATYKPAYYYGTRQDYAGFGTACAAYMNPSQCDGGLPTWPTPVQTMTNSVVTNLVWNPILEYSLAAYLNGYSESCGLGATDLIRFSVESIRFKSSGSPYVLAGSAQGKILSMQSFWNIYTLSGTYAPVNNPWYSAFDTSTNVSNSVICGIVTAYVGHAVSPGSFGWFTHFVDWAAVNATNAAFDGAPCSWTGNKKYSDEPENPCYPNPVYPMSDLGDLGCGESWKSTPVLAKYIDGGRHDANAIVPCDAFSILTWDFTYK